MATLRPVTHPEIDFPILMKLPRLLGEMDPAAVTGFEMEQMILPRISGLHVPRFVAAGEFTVQSYIVMERIPGPSLLSKLDRLPLPCPEVAAIGARVASALHDLHRQGVVHLDVKPSSIVRRETGEAVLVDYGLARHDRLPDLMEEQFRIPYGTGPYMAPEQILGVRRDPVPPRKRNADLPPWLQEVILRCLEVDPARRHPTAAQLAFDLTHPESVTLTGRSERLKQDPWIVAVRCRFDRDAVALVLKHAVAAGTRPGEEP